MYVQRFAQSTRLALALTLSLTPSFRSQHHPRTCIYTYVHMQLYATMETRVLVQQKGASKRPPNWAESNI